MPRKRRRDLREFWPWYERKMILPHAYYAEPPPFDLNDISVANTPERMSPSARRLIAGLFIAFAILMFGFIVSLLVQ